MADGFLKSLDKNLEIVYAGAEQADKINPF
jgi:hypothetical protein